MIKPLEKWRVINLAQQMVSNFCGFLSMSSKLDVPGELLNEDNAIRICVQNITNNAGQPNGMVIETIASSFWLPIPSQVLHEFFKDPFMRHKVILNLIKHP